MFYFRLIANFPFPDCVDLSNICTYPETETWTTLNNGRCALLFVMKIKIRITFVPQLNLLIVAKLPEPIK